MKQFLAFLAASFLMISCSNDDSQATTPIEGDTSSFILDGVSYEIKMNENGTLNKTSLDEKVLKILDTGYSLRVSDSKDIYLFEEEASMSTYIKENITETTSFVPQDASKNLKALAFFYEHHNFIGGSRVGRDAFYFDDLKPAPHSFNDRISSCEIENFSDSFYVVDMYQHSIKRGRKHTEIVLPRGTKSVSDFVPIGFNDIVSSIEAYFL